jgi:putative transposase
MAWSRESADVGVTKSHSRPHCSNDNPYSEAQFNTLKYRSEFPGRFGSIEDGRAFSLSAQPRHVHHRLLSTDKPEEIIGRNNFIPRSDVVPS